MIEHIVLFLTMLSVTARTCHLFFRIVSITYLKQSKDVFTGHLSYFENGSPTEFPICRKTSPLPLCDARSIRGQILSGREHLHDLGYIHRDLKPINVLLRNLKPLEVVIREQGFAQESSRTTMPGGSGLWSSPECLWSENGSRRGVSVDVYSTRVILLWLLNVYADDGKCINERGYDELFGHKIRKASDSSESSSLVK